MIRNYKTITLTAEDKRGFAIHTYTEEEQKERLKKAVGYFRKTRIVLSFIVVLVILLDIFIPSFSIHVELYMAANLSAFAFAFFIVCVLSLIGDNKRTIKENNTYLQIKVKEILKEESETTLDSEHVNTYHYFPFIGEDCVTGYSSVCYGGKTLSANDIVKISLIQDKNGKVRTFEY